MDSRYNTSTSRRSRTVGSAADVIEEFPSTGDDDLLEEEEETRKTRQLESLRSTLRSMRQGAQTEGDNSSTLKSHSTLRSAQQQQITQGGTLRRLKITLLLLKK